MSSSVRIIRRILLFTLVLGLLGTGIELLLLEHFEEWRQMIPLGVIACALLVLAWHGMHRGPAPVRALQVLMIIFAIAGATRLTLHYKGNKSMEQFRREIGKYVDRTEVARLERYVTLE